MSFSLTEPLIIQEKRRQNTNCLFKYLNQKINNHIVEIRTQNDPYSKRVP